MRQPFTQMNRNATRFALIVGTIHRALTLIIAALAFNANPPRIDWNAQPIYNLHEIAFTSQGWLRALLDPWYRWDTGWYIAIAYNGYAGNRDSIIYPPLYPLLMRIFAPVFGGDYLLAGMVISTAAAYIALYLLYRLTAADHNERTARSTVILFVCYPAAFYLMAAYTESLFIALVLGAWLAVTERRYWLAGGLAFLASLTRSQGWVLAFPFAYMVYIAPHMPTGATLITGVREAIRHTLKRPLTVLRPLPAVIGGLIGTVAYVFGLRAAGYGDVSAQFASPQWETPLIAPWESVIRSIQAVALGGANPYFGNDLANFLALVFVVVLGIWVTIRLKPQYALFVWVTLLFILLRGYRLIQLHGLLRYALAMFPLFMMLALLTGSQRMTARLTRIGYLVISVSVQIVLLILFVWWGWVS